MAEHYLTKTQVDLGQCLEVGGEMAIEAYPKLLEALAPAGEDTFSLFAEPLLSRGNDQVAPSVSWYTDVQGTATPFNRLGDAQQAELSNELSRRMAPLQTMVGDAANGPLVGSALHIADLNDVWSVDGVPVIINWGMLPSGMTRDSEVRSAHYAQTLGRFLPLGAAPPLSLDESNEIASASAAQNSVAPAAAVAAGAAAGTLAAGTAAAASSQPTSQEPAAQTADSMTPPPPPPPPSSTSAAAPQRVPLWAWVPLLALLLLATGVLIWLLIPGNRLFPDRAQEQPVTDEAALAAAQNTNRALEARLAELQSAIDGAMCEADGTLLMPDGRTIEGLLPPNRNDRTDVPGATRPADRTAILPPDPERVQVPDAASPQDTTSLVDFIEARTAMVLAVSPNGLGNGTGFFVGPDLLVTNHHVISNPGVTDIYVTNNALGTVKPAQVLKTMGPYEQTGGDFALLRVAGANQPAFTVLEPSESLRLQSVIAAGYPGDILDSDAKFKQLLKGDRTAVPGLAMTDGTVSVEQTMSPVSKVVVHSAPISKGNSGGPLVDMCGQLVGVNTFVRVGRMRSLNFALSSPDLMRFLKNTDALPQVVTQSCNPQVQRPVAPQAAAAAAPQGTGELPKLPALKPQSE
ncbi:MAG: trypsin-like peptidase domain-containing protein [Pseudomonadota bacterium]